MRKFIVVALLILFAGPACATVTPMQRMAAAGVKDIPVDFQILADYDARTDGQPIYLGQANRTAATSDSVWVIYKFTYDGLDQMTSRKTAYGIWDNRATLTYQ